MNIANHMNPNDLLQRLVGARVTEFYVGNGNMVRLTATRSGQEASLRTWGCAWQVCDSTRLLVASNDELERGPAVPDLIGRSIQGVEAESASRNLVVRVDGGFEVLFMLTEALGDDYAFQWSFHPAGDVHLMVRAGGRWQIEANESSKQHQ